LENVFERLKFADLFQTEELKFACAEMIWNHLKQRGLKRPEWMEFKKNFPELAFYILEKFF
jgi:hypothetical protein